MKILDKPVYPSNYPTVSVVNDDNQYGGAHHYILENCKGFKDGKTQYGGGTQTIQFVQTLEDGTTTAGLQSEQLVIMLIDRIQKLNTLYPAPQNDKAILGLQMFLDAHKERIDERIGRGVMGELKK